MSYRILQLISSAGFFGAENVLIELSTELQAMGISITIGIFNNQLRPDLELMKRARERSLHTHVFRCRGRFDLGTISQICKYLKSENIDIIHSHGYKSNIYALLSSWNKNMLLVSTCHNWITLSNKMIFYSYLDKIALRKFDIVIPVSNSVKKSLLSSGVSNKKISLIENGINVQRFSTCEETENIRREIGISLTRKVIGTVGRLSEEKGHKYLLLAAQEILKVDKNCIFLIVGDGNLRCSLELEAKALGIDDNIIFLGKRSDIPLLLSIMDIFVLPSLIEGQPMALLEAMAAKKPVVATNVGDIQKILKHNYSGYLVSPCNSEAIAEGIFYYLNNFENALKNGENAFNEVINNYSSVRMAREYLYVYNKYLQNG